MRRCLALSVLLCLWMSFPVRAAETLAGDALTDPSCQSIFADRVDCFWIGQNGPMHHWSDAGGNGVEAMPVHNPADFAGTPRCVALSGFEFDCLALHRKGFLVRSTYRGSWSAWEPVPAPAGTRVASDPSCVALKASNVCYVRGEDSKVYLITTAANTIGAWSQFGTNNFAFNSMTAVLGPACIAADSTRTGVDEVAVLCALLGRDMPGGAVGTLIFADWGGSDFGGARWHGPWSPSSGADPAKLPVCGTAGSVEMTVCWHLGSLNTVAANFVTPLGYRGAHSVDGAIVEAVGWCGYLDLPEAQLTCLGRSVEGEIIWTAKGRRADGSSTIWRPWTALTNTTGGNRKPIYVGLPSCVSRGAGGADCYVRRRDGFIERLRFDGVKLD